MFRLLGLGLITLIASYLGVAAMLSWTRRRDLLDIPNDRSSHTTPTPHGGGVVMVSITLAGLAILSLVTGEWGVWWWYGVGGALIAVVSWFDDLHDLPGGLRFLVHGIGAVLALTGFGFWREVSLPFVSPIALGWAGAVVSFFWIVGLTNAFNFMDGIDGIAGLQAIFAGLAWAVLGWWTGQSAVLLIGLLITCGSIGFLFHNWSPARIFMGDVGSAFLGYTFSVLPLMAMRGTPAANRLALTGIVIMWPFAFDAALTLVRRTLHGENVFRAHRSHLYQRLVDVGWTHRAVASIYGGLALLSASAALIWYRQAPGSNYLVVLTAVVLGGGIWLLTIGQERRHAANITEPESLARERL